MTFTNRELRRIRAVEYGTDRALDDIEAFTNRADVATTDELLSKWWLFKHALYAGWRGFLAPPLWRVAGRAYHRAMKEWQR